MPAVKPRSWHQNLINERESYNDLVTWEMLLIAAVRVAGSLPVLRWAFVGAILAMLMDLSDLFIRDLVDLGGVKDYQRFDKWLDQVYMLAFLTVALRWDAVPRNIAIGLYAFRLAGFVTFEVSGERDILLFFPNVFEFWFVFVAGVQFFNVRFSYSRAQLAAALPLLLAGKLLHEYSLHVGRWFDGFSSLEAVEAVWNWLTAPFW